MTLFLLGEGVLLAFMQLLSVDFYVVELVPEGDLQ